MHSRTRDVRALGGSGRARELCCGHDPRHWWPRLRCVCSPGAPVGSEGKPRVVRDRRCPRRTPLPPIDLSACGERACLNLLAPQLQRRPLGDCIMGQGRPSTGRNNREGSETTSSPLPIPWTRKKLLRSLFRFCFLRAGGRKRALRGRNLCLGGTNILARFLGY